MSLSGHSIVWAAIRAALCCAGKTVAAFGLLCSIMFGAGGGTATAGDSSGGASDNPLYFTIGSYGVFVPKFEGSRGHEISPWPIFSWHNQNDRQWLDLPRDGLEYTLYETDNFRFGAAGMFRWQRDSNTLLPRGFAKIGQGNSSIDLSLEAGAFVEYWPMQWLRTRLEARETIYGARGLVGYLSSDAVWRPTSAWTFSAGPRISIADREFMEDYYSVNASQAVNSGLPVFRAQAGLRSFGAGTFAKYKIDQAWTTKAFFEYEHLIGDAGDSPLITTRGSREQYMIGLGLSYTFKAPWEK